jgi:hypothetical protein
MNDNLKNNWNNLDEFSDIPGYGFKSINQFLGYRSDTIFDKIRWIFYGDLLRKLVGTLFIICGLVIYHDKMPLVTILSLLLIIQLFASWFEIKALQNFNKISNPASSPKNILSAILVFLKSSFTLPLISMSSSFVFIFVPGLLLYFELVYGYLKPITPFDYLAFCGLCLIGIIMSFTIIRSQLNFHIKHLRVCLSDLNEDTLFLVSQNIESQRKQDEWIKVLVSLALIIGFVALLAALKSSIG